VLGPRGQGALGLGHDETIGDDEGPTSEPPVLLGEDRRAVALALGGYHTCALLETGALRCWGPEDVGPLIDTAPGRPSGS
jgi:alpha-tubulin suppressor-like RCC1 family protein